MQKINWERTAAILFTLGIGAVLLLLLIRYAFPIVFPFLLAWGIAALIRKPASILAKRLSLSQTAVSFLLLLFLLSAVVWLLFASVRRVFFELSQLLERILSAEGMAESLEGPIDYFGMLTSRLSFLRRMGAGERFASLREGFNKAVGDLLEGLLQSLSATLPPMAAGLLSALPSILLSVVITVIAGFYFCAGKTTLSHILISVLPSPLKPYVLPCKERLLRISTGYLRAYLFLFLLTFSELFLGFCILRVEYAFLLALLIALVDLLPVLGVGAVLIPWSLLLLLQRNFRLGVGLLILFAAVAVIRQIMEPRLLGKSLGLDPLLTLFVTYAGWKLFGIVGMLLSPFAALALKGVMERQKRV